MDTSPIPGFITRKQASEKCKRAERTLQRYWSRAIEHADVKVLEHLKLRTEDGEIIEGPQVTKDLIDQLKKSSKNPTWYVHATWVEKTYGPRVEDKAANSASAGTDAATGDSDSLSRPTVDTQVVDLMKERIHQLEQDKQDLREEMKIKNDQINQANERDRETHHLMRDLHKLLADMQQRLPTPSSATLPVSTESGDHRLADAETAAEAVVVAPSQTPNVQKGIAASPKKGSPSKTRDRNSPKKAKKKTAKKPPKSAFQKHTPTFHKAVTGLFRRS